MGERNALTNTTNGNILDLKDSRYKQFKNEL